MLAQNTLGASKRCFSYSWRYVPQSDQALLLKSKYHEPERLTTEVLKTHRLKTNGHAEEVSYKSMLNGLLWKAKLKVPWPFPFCVSGVSSSPGQAQEHAYLLLCASFKDMGLIGQKGEVLDWKQHLLEFQDKCYLKWRAQEPISFNNVRYIQPDGKPLWKSCVNMTWPMMLHAEGEGAKQSHAEQDAAARLIIKLKAMKFVDGNNQIMFPEILLMPFKDRLREKSTPPDFEIFVDASASGFGAYLFENNNPNTDSVFWIQEHWPSLDSQNVDFQSQKSTFLEFYAIVSAVYTWKKKCKGCHVKVWTDNSSASRFINNGFSVQDRNHIKRYFQVLQDVSTYYQIQLEAQHVPRVQHQAADFLSKCQITEFKELIPFASTFRKKCKKLTFIDVQRRDANFGTEDKKQQYLNTKK